MKVLVVDDEAIIRKGVTKLLYNCSQAVTDVKEAKNGSAALEQIEREKPDLIICDIRMPVMDGLALAQEVARRYGDIPVAILTGYADFQYAQQALRYQVIEYLLKPVTQEALNDILLRIMLKNPSSWTEDLDSNGLQLLKKSVNDLAKAVLAENRDELDGPLRELELFCVRRGMSLLEAKQILGYFHVAYKSEMMTHQPEPIEGEQSVGGPSMTISGLFEDWRRYLLVQIENISKRRMPRNKRVVDQTIKAIADSYHDADLNIGVLAAQSGITSAYLSKIFREVMNVPITQYISQYRLEQARNRLERDKETKISRIAEQCGFSDYPYFSKVYKRTFGVSPLEYREKV